MKITLFSNHCPKCKVLEKLMRDKNIEFTLVDSEELVFKVADENNINSMPFAEVNGNILTTKELQDFINSTEGK